jgi:hypothetical protein
MKIYNIVTTITVTATLLIGISNSANALPSQEINSVIQWSNKHAFLPKLTSVKKLEDGYPDYSSNLNFQGGFLSFDVYKNKNNIVTSETIDYRTYQGGDKNLRFAKNNQNGLRLVEKVYGSSVTQDFKNSKYVTQLASDGYLRFYRGQKFAYQVWSTKSAHQFTVIPVSKLQEKINNWKKQL